MSSLKLLILEILWIFNDKVPMNVEDHWKKLVLMLRFSL